MPSASRAGTDRTRLLIDVVLAPATAVMTGWFGSCCLRVCTSSCTKLRLVGVSTLGASWISLPTAHMRSAGWFRTVARRFATSVALGSHEGRVGVVRCDHRQVDTEQHRHAAARGRVEQSQRAVAVERADRVRAILLRETEIRPSRDSFYVVGNTVARHGEVGAASRDLNPPGTGKTRCRARRRYTRVARGGSDGAAVRASPRPRSPRPGRTARARASSRRASVDAACRSP